MHTSNTYTRLRLNALAVLVALLVAYLVSLFVSAGDVFGNPIATHRVNYVNYTPAFFGEFNGYDCSAQTDIPVAECEALVALYDATGGDSWTDNSGWLSGAPCSWYRVTCAGGHVVQLELIDNGLVGPIPSSLADLDSLQILDFEINGLNGSIPASLGNLSRLYYLSLVRNELTGPIPESFGSMDRLSYLYLGENELTGSIPESLGELDVLSYLVLNDNNLTGPIPASLGDIPYLSILSLSRNNLSGTIPESLGNLTTLYALQLDSNSLEGPIPSSLANLTGLDFLQLNSNGLQQTVPLSVAQRGLAASLCDFTDNDSLCMPDIPAYQALGDPICGLPLDAACQPILELAAPADGATGLTTSPTLRWSDLGDGIRYDVQVSVDDAFKSVVHSTNVPDTLTPFVAPVAGHKYFWRVRAVYGNRTYDWVEPWEFSVGMSGPLAVTLLAPADKATNQTKILDFSWTTAPGAVAYRFELSESENFATKAVEEPALSSTSYLAKDLKGGVKYYWRVAGVDGIGRKTWSQSRSFTTVVDVPGAITLLEPEDGTTGIPTMTSFSWESKAGAGTYQLQVADDSAFANVVVNDSANSKTTSTLSSPLDYGTMYRWRVRGRNAGGNGAWSEVRSFTTIVAAPEAVTLISPTDGAAGVSTAPIFIWDAVASAATYQLQVATDSLFSSVVINDTALTATADSVSASLANDSEHYWRVRASNEGGDGPWSDVYRFTTIIAAPDAVTLVAPANGATEVAAYTTFSWQPLDGAAAYHLQVGSDAGLTSLVIDDSTLTAATFIASMPLAYSTGYYWHIRAALDDGLGKTTGLLFGPWSETRSFTVAVGTATEDQANVPTAFALHPAYPNPFNPSTTIRYDIPEVATVRLTIFDGLGRRIEELGTWHLAPGTYSVTWNASTHPSGLYFVRMQAEAFTQTRRMILTK